MRLARLAMLALALVATAAAAQPPPRHFDREERMRLREDVRRDDAAHEARRKGGRMSREEAMRNYRERGEGRGWRSPEEREQMRRDIQDANRSMEHRRRR